MRPCVSAGSQGEFFYLDNILTGGQHFDLSRFRGQNIGLSIGLSGLFSFNIAEIYW